MMASTKTVTKGDWGFGSSHQHGTKDWEISAYRFYPRDGKPSLHRKGDMDGVIVHSSEEVTRIGLEHGYTQPYGRNLTGFVMSRAARKRGIQSSERWYVERLAERPAKRRD